MISKSKPKKLESSLKQKELESLKEVSEDSNSSQSEIAEDDYSRSINNKTNNNLSNQEKEELLKNYNNKSKKIRCCLKIYKEQEIVFTTDFFDSIILPNLCFEGKLIPQDLLTPQKVNPKEKKEITNFPTEELNNFINDMPYYKIYCYVEGGEIPKSLRIENSTIDWKIQIFSSDTIAFVKDTCKEDSERALINTWEQNQPGRSLRAENARMKFVEDRKLQIDTYIQENEKGKFYIIKNIKEKIIL